MHSVFKTWQLKHEGDVLPTDNTRKYRIKSLDVCKDDLSNTKSKLDDEYKKYKFAAYWSNFDPFKYEKNTVAVIGNTLNVSNAWLKCFELILAYDLIKEIDAPLGDKNSPTYNSTSTFLHFDNAAFPGSFVIATHHLVNTLYSSVAAKYVWRASSLLNANEQNAEPLEDKYGLYNNYKNHWLMHADNNGDVLVENNQLDFHKQLGGKVNLYTSDLGFDVSSDYNNQELIQLPANVGQILTGLLTLKKGGSFITKQYTTFEPATISVMYAVSYFFDEFYLCKPYTSRMANSETYLVGKGFKGNATLDHPYIKAMFDRISNRIDIKIPIFDASLYPKLYLSTIIKSAKDLTNTQIEKLDADIDRVNKCLINRHKGNPRDNPVVSDFYESVEPLIEEWYQLCNILPIADEKKLKMNDALKQH